MRAFRKNEGCSSRKVRNGGINHAEGVARQFQVRGGVHAVLGIGVKKEGLAKTGAQCGNTHTYLTEITSTVQQHKLIELLINLVSKMYLT